MNIYIDMDDVVADWTGFANKFFDTPNRPATHYLPDEEWAKLKTQQRMYAQLELKEGAHELVQMCISFAREIGGGVFFLTALPHDDSFPFAAYDKVHWADSNFYNVPVFFGPYAKDKHNFCAPGDILIDDRRSNCEDWVKAGGLSCIYTTWEACKPWLLEIFNERLRNR